MSRSQRRISSDDLATGSAKPATVPRFDDTAFSKYQLDKVISKEIIQHTCLAWLSDASALLTGEPQHCCVQLYRDCSMVRDPRHKEIQSYIYAQYSTWDAAHVQVHELLLAHVSGLNTAIVIITQDSDLQVNPTEAYRRSISTS